MYNVGEIVENDPTEEDNLVLGINIVLSRTENYY